MLSLTEIRRWSVVRSGGPSYAPPVIVARCTSMEAALAVCRLLDEPKRLGLVEHLDWKEG